MAQINEYPNEALTLNNGDLFDIDADIGFGDFESKKVSFGTLISQIGGGLNLGTSDLTQTDPQRIFSGTGNSRLTFEQLRRYFIELSEWGDDPLAGFLLNQGGAVGFNRTMAKVTKNGKIAMQVYENGHVEISPQFWAVDGQVGGIAVGDGSLSVSSLASLQSNPGILALFASANNPTVFTDLFLPSAPDTFTEQDSAIAWFRSLTKGVLFPTMSEIQRDAIITPEFGLQIYNLDANKMQVYTGIGLSGWSNMN